MQKVVNKIETQQMGILNQDCHLQLCPVPELKQKRIEITI